MNEKRIFKYQLPFYGKASFMNIDKILLVDFQGPALCFWAEHTEGGNNQINLYVAFTGENVPNGEHVGSAATMLDGDPFVVHLYRVPE